VSRWLPIALVGLALVACAQREVPDERFYRLEPPAPAERFASPPLAGLLVVERPLAEGVVGERPLLYTEATAPGLLQYHYHSWAGAPDRMVQDMLVRCLRAGNAAERVLAPEQALGAPRYRLAGQLNRLEQWRGDDPRVEVEMELGLVRRRDGALLWVEHFRAKAPAPDASVAGAVRAFDTAFARICERVLERLAA